MEATDMQKKHIEQQPARLYLLPLLLSGGIILFDQITKFIVIKTIPVYGTAGDSIKEIWGELLWFMHIYNRGAMFSLGNGFDGLQRMLFLFILPVILILFMLYIVVYSNWVKEMRWVAAGIVGGGIGNMIDRFFRDEGVLDFISVNFYGIFGLYRWPTFNIADASVVISMIFWILFMIFPNMFSKQNTVSKPNAISEKEQDNGTA